MIPGATNGVGSVDSLERIAHSRITVLIFLCQMATGEIVIGDPLGDVIGRPPYLAYYDSSAAAQAASVSKNCHQLVIRRKRKPNGHKQMHTLTERDNKSNNVLMTSLRSFKADESLRTAFVVCCSRRLLAALLACFPKKTSGCIRNPSTSSCSERRNERT